MEELELEELNNSVADLQDIIFGFVHFFKVENEALRKFDVEAVSNLYEHKGKTVSAYRSMSAFFIKNQ